MRLKGVVKRREIVLYRGKEEGYLAGDDDCGDRSLLRLERDDQNRPTEDLPREE